MDQQERAAVAVVEGDAPVYEWRCGHCGWMLASYTPAGGVSFWAHDHRRQHVQIVAAVAHEGVIVACRNCGQRERITATAGGGINIEVWRGPFHVRP